METFVTTDEATRALITACHRRIRGFTGESLAVPFSPPMLAVFNRHLREEYERLYHLETDRWGSIFFTPRFAPLDMAEQK